MGLVVQPETDGHTSGHCLLSAQGRRNAINLVRATRMAVWVGGVDMGVFKGREQQCGPRCTPEVWTVV